MHAYKIPNSLEVKPCPFCKMKDDHFNEVTKFVRRTQISYSVACSRCLLVGPSHVTEDGALDFWNRLPRETESPKGSES